MTLTLLFDLDGTLLDTDLNSLVPAYFQSLAEHLAPHIPPESLIKYLAAGTRAMMASTDPANTLREVFNDSFYPSLNVDSQFLQPILEDYYDNIFPTLQAHAKQIDGAQELINWAFSAGHRVAIATSPFFPRKATLARLRWAGLPPEKYPFEIISSYETFHFLKPHPAYVAEVMARLGWPDGPALMIGNDVEQDLQPAAILGLPTFHTLDTTPSANGFAPTGRGLLAELRAWLEQTDLSALVPGYASSESSLAILRATPAALTSLLESESATTLTTRPAPEEWSITEVLCHMRDVEREINQPRVDLIVNEHEPFVPAQMPDDWVEARAYARQDAHTALRDFTSARLGTLERLVALEPAQWARKARHAIFGPTPLSELVAFNAEHDRMHIQQIFKCLTDLRK